MGGGVCISYSDPAWPQQTCSVQHLKLAQSPGFQLTGVYPEGQKEGQLYVRFHTLHSQNPFLNVDLRCVVVAWTNSMPGKLIMLASASHMARK